MNEHWISNTFFVWQTLWPYISFILYVFFSIWATVHVLFTKTDSRSSMGWIGLIWFSPFLGSFLYAMMGVNRIKRRATLLKKPGVRSILKQLQIDAQEEQSLAAIPEHLKSISNIHAKLMTFPLSTGNDVEILSNGEQAYPAMLQAIDQARSSIALSTYIFDIDPLGKQFVKALCAAADRGVEVRVLVDSVGQRYSFPSVLHLFKGSAVKTAQFLPSLWPWRMPYVNLRSHRKIMVVDGALGFTGGMNIRQGHCLKSSATHKIQDTHFALQGPIVKQLQSVFVMDWLFAKGELLEGQAWFPELSVHGSVALRSVADGPDEDINTLHLMLCTAIGAAKKQINIMTPYFLPDKTLKTLLIIASKRGVEVNIIVPEHNNLNYVDWASQFSLEKLLNAGCNIYLSRDPFDHSKLMLVDHYWFFFGSANWDARSLRLNFEFNIEAYDQALAKKITELIDTKINTAKKINDTYFKQQSYLKKIRNGFARLFEPYL